MKKALRLTGALLILAAFTAAAGELIQTTVSIPSGSTNAVKDVTLNYSGSTAAAEIDAIVYYNGGDATGTLSFAAADLGVERSLGEAVTANTLTGGVAYPVRAIVSTGLTNLTWYTANKVRITITQDTTNAADYTVGILTR